MDLPKLAMKQIYINWLKNTEQLFFFSTELLCSKWAAVLDFSLSSLDTGASPGLRIKEAKNRMDRSNFFI